MDTPTIDADIQEKVVLALRRCPLFRLLKPELVPQLLTAAEIVSFSPGEAIVRQGEAADAFFVLAEGEATIWVEGPGGEGRELGRVPRPSSIGEVGLLLCETRTATVTALTEVIAAKFKAKAFEQMFLKIPGFGLGLSAGLALRLQSLSGMVPLPDHDLAAEPPAPEALALLPMPFVQRHRIVPVRQDGRVVTLGFVDDPSSQAMTALHELLPGVEIQAVRVTAASFDALLSAQGGVDAWRGALDVDADATAAAAAARRSPKLDPMLERVVAEGASDLHLSPGIRPRWRVDGDMREIADAPVLGPDDAFRLLEPVMEERHRAELQEQLDVDFAYAVPGLARFRVNVYRESHGTGAALRQIPSRILTFEQLGLPAVIADLCEIPKGLILVTGPTGSGKSTTLAAMIDRINRNRQAHIVTIEDPIEFVHQTQQCLVTQREIGGQARSFARGLRAALREDPDIILVGEMRDAETIALVLEAANTGHLVFATLHTNTAVSAVDRIVDQFPADQQSQVRSVLADVLRGVIAQTLCRRVAGGRTAAIEVLVVNQAIANLIRENKTVQVPGMMQTGRAQGMSLLNDELMHLVESKTITMAEATANAVDKADFQRRFRSGVTLAEEPGRPGVFRVAQVEGSLPGAEAGLARADVIVEIDGKPIPYTLEQMRVVFRTDGRHTLTVERAGKRRPVILELKRVL
jgi:twitching motility protein PilT